MRAVTGWKEPLGKIYGLFKSIKTLAATQWNWSMMKLKKIYALLKLALIIP